MLSFLHHKKNKHVDKIVDETHLDTPKSLQALTVDHLHKIGELYINKYGDPTIPSKKSKWWCCTRVEKPHEEAVRKWVGWLINIKPEELDQRQAWFNLADIWYFDSQDELGYPYPKGDPFFVKRESGLLARIIERYFEDAIPYKYAETMTCNSVYNTMYAQLNAAYQHHARPGN